SAEGAAAARIAVRDVGRLGGALREGGPIAERGEQIEQLLLHRRGGAFDLPLHRGAGLPVQDLEPVLVGLLPRVRAEGVGAVVEKELGAVCAVAAGAPLGEERLAVRRVSAARERV